MPHLADGTLRRLHDEPDFAAAADRAHLAGCVPCSARLERLAGAGDEVQRLLAAEQQGVLDVAAARAVVVARSLTARPARRSALARAFASPLLATPLVGVAAALALVLLVVVTPLRSVANGFLAIFEPQQIVAVPVTREDLQQLRALPNLASFGTVHDGPRQHPATVTSATEASALAGMTVAVPSLLPPGASRAVYFVQPRTSSTFTFSAAKARAAATAAGKVMPAMPPRVDGSTLMVTIGPVVVATYGESSRLRLRHGHFGMSQLFVAQAPVPQVGSTGASARDIESFLLAQPGVPPQLAAEIAAIGDPATTLPIPIPVDKAYASPVTVQGTRGLGMGDNTGLGSGVVWERDGIIHAVGGAMRMSQVLAIANSLSPSGFTPLKSLARPIGVRR